MRNIFILYDSTCALCGQCKTWIASQRQIVKVTFVAAASPEARRLFPHLDHARTEQELTAIGDSGDVYHGAKAWLMCLWSLDDYRTWARKIATPELLPTAQKIIATISSNRKNISKLIA